MKLDKNYSLTHGNNIMTHGNNIMTRGNNFMPCDNPSLTRGNPILTLCNFSLTRGNPKHFNTISLSEYLRTDSSISSCHLYKDHKSIKNVRLKTILNTASLFAEV